SRRARASVSRRSGAVVPAPVRQLVDFRRGAPGHGRPVGPHQASGRQLLVGLLQLLVVDVRGRFRARLAARAVPAWCCLRSTSGRPGGGGGSCVVAPPGRPIFCLMVDAPPGPPGASRPPPGRAGPRRRSARGGGRRRSAASRGRTEGGALGPVVD